MKGTLYIQREKGRPIEKPKGIECDIDMGRGNDRDALAGIGHKVIAIMKRPQVEFISANGLMISGVVETSLGPRPVLHYQEWWFVPIIQEVAPEATNEV